MNRTPLLAAAVALLLLPMGAAAQSSVAVKARVQATATGTATGELNFGTLLPGAAATTVALTHDNSGGTTLGVLTISHTGNFSVSGTTIPTALTLTGATDIPVTFECQLATSATGSTGLTGSAAGCGSTFSHTTGGNSTVYLRVGGTLNAIPADQASGDYAGTISFTISTL